MGEGPRAVKINGIHILKGVERFFRCQCDAMRFAVVRHLRVDLAAEGDERHTDALELR